MIRLLYWYLYILAKSVLWWHKPIIIAITGNVGKTSAREAVFAVLSAAFDARRSEKNFNNEIGTPLTILGWPHHGRNPFIWLWGLVKLPGILRRSYPKVLVLEMGADHPGDIEYLARLARPHIAVITAIGEVPVHIEFFKTPEQLAEEKAKLLQKLSFSGYAVLNADDPRVLAMQKVTNASVITYGTGEHAEYRIENHEIRYRDDHGEKIPEGISFKVSHRGSVVPIRLIGSLSTSQAMAATAAFAVGELMGMNAVEISDALRKYAPPPGRLNLLRGNKQTLILDDTYNAAPAAMEAALETLRALPGRRKIAIIGDMLELGTYTEEAHRRAGRIAASVADIIATVGERMRFANEEIRRLGFDETMLYHVDSSRDVARIVEPILEPGDLILVKGSQGTRMEHVVEDIMAEPERAKELLVRQSPDWKAKP